MNKRRSLKITPKKKKELLNQLHSFVEDSMLEFGKFVIEDRALPDYRDGFKPVHRRIMWSMHKLGLTNDKAPTKSANIVGLAMGKYHPHGDKAIYDALVNMTNAHDNNKAIYKNIAVGLGQGQGNFGSIEDNAAAQRYTEAKPSKYADETILNSKYLEIIDKIPNYMGDRDEPLILPALLPNLLLNGSEGIAVGVTTIIPPFQQKGLVQLINKILKGKKIDEKDCLEHLEFNYPNGAILVPEKSELKKYYKTGLGKVSFRCGYTINEDKRTMAISQLTPKFNLDSVTNNMLKDPNVSAVRNMTSKEIQIDVILKSSVNKSDAKAILEGLAKKYLHSSISYKTNITIRSRTEENEMIDKDTEFKSWSIVELITNWTEWRVELELRMLRNELSKVEAQLDHQKLLLFAISKLDVIFKVLKSKTSNLDEQLSKKLDISMEDAKRILDLQTRRLSRLSEDDIKKKMTALKKDIKQYEAWIKKPEKKILTDLDSLPQFDC